CNIITSMLVRRASIDPAQKARMRTFAVWLAALALFLQTLVIDTHVDIHGLPAHEIAFANADQPQAASAETLSLGADHAACLICQTLAANGASLAPTFASVREPPPPALAAPTRTTNDVVARASHAWRSRAPPISLNA
ncbi:MAG: DUF2946 family protein, partial [Caulobacterales bacterium]